MSQSGLPSLSNIYKQNAYFSGNGVSTNLVAPELKRFRYNTHIKQSRPSLDNGWENLGYGGNEKSCFSDNG
jgi:hypothetical protein